MSGKTSEYVLFWGCGPSGYVQKGCFSQWWKCSFEIDGRTFTSAEQYMMYMKAVTFGDSGSADAIMGATSPKEIKALGRGVRNFDPAVWDKVKYGIVVDGNMAKFSQNPSLKEFLLSTGDAVIAEASPKDRVWGIGLGEENPKARDMKYWRGQNLLGKALMEVRERLGGKTLAEDYVLSDNLHNRFWSRSQSFKVSEASQYEVTPASSLFFSLDPVRTGWYAEDKRDAYCAIVEMNGQTRIMNLLDPQQFSDIGLSPHLSRIFKLAEPYFSYSSDMQGSATKKKKGDLAQFIPDSMHFALLCLGWCIVKANLKSNLSGKLNVYQLITKHSADDVDAVRRVYDAAVYDFGLDRAINMMCTDVVTGDVKIWKRADNMKEKWFKSVVTSVDYDAIDALVDSILEMYEVQPEYAKHQIAVDTAEAWNKQNPDKRPRTAQASHIETLQRALHAMLTANGFSGYYCKEKNRDYAPESEAVYDTLVLFDASTIRRIAWCGSIDRFQIALKKCRENSKEQHVDNLYEAMVDMLVSAESPSAITDLCITGTILADGGVKKQYFPPAYPYKIPGFLPNSVAGSLQSAKSAISDKLKHLSPKNNNAYMTMRVNDAWYYDSLLGEIHIYGMKGQEIKQSGPAIKEDLMIDYWAHMLDESTSDI